MDARTEGSDRPHRDRRGHRYVVGETDRSLEEASAGGPLARVRTSTRDVKVTVLGATGNVGGRVAIELFRSAAVKRLRLTARHRDDAATFASRFGKNAGPSVITDELDIMQPDLARGFVGEDVVVNCAGPGYELEPTAARAAVEAGVDYVSLCDDHSATDEVLALDTQAVERGISVVSGCGMSPGITNYLVAAAALELDEVVEIQIAVGASSADSDGYASARHTTFALSQDAPFLSGGATAMAKAGTLPRRIYFPEPVGWVETFVCGHPEIATLSRSRPQVGTIQFRLGLTERVVMDLLRASRASGLLKTEPMRKAWLASTWPTRSLVERIPPRGPTWTALRVDVHGTKDGTASIVSLGSVDHLVNLASQSIKEAALALGRGEVAAKGVRGAEEVFDAVTMLERLAARGVRAARLEPEPV